MSHLNLSRFSMAHISIVFTTIIIKNKKDSYKVSRIILIEILFSIFIIVKKKMFNRRNVIRKQWTFIIHLLKKLPIRK